MSISSGICGINIPLLDAGCPSLAGGVIPKLAALSVTLGLPAITSGLVVCISGGTLALIVSIFGSSLIMGAGSNVAPVPGVGSDIYSPN